MKVQIRRGVFETNSSSIHTLTIAKGSIDPKLAEPYAGKTVIKEDGDYGWEWETYSDFRTKLDYLAQALYYSSYSNQSTPQISLNQTLLWRQQLAEFLKKYGIDISYQLSKIVWDPDHTYWELEDPAGASLRGYIDHGSEIDGFISIVMTDETKLFRFLFDPASEIHTGNDNSDQDPIEIKDEDYSCVYTKGN